MEIQKTPREALEHAIELVGGMRKLAEGLSPALSTSNVRHWLTRGVPVKWCSGIERLTGGAVRREELCPLFEWVPLANTAPTQKQSGERQESAVVP
jgi:DNA-binding transcriptional regulator YdaS (Cro superfamily)